MTALLVYLQATPVTQIGVESWEIAKGIMLSLSTLGVGYLVRSVHKMEFAVMELQREVFDKDGNNGLKREAARQKDEIAAIKDRNLAIDTLAKKERDQYQGEERRRHLRRERDQVFPNPLDGEDER